MLDGEDLGYIVKRGKRKNLEFLFWIQGSVIRPKIGYLIDGPVLLILERNEISVKAAKEGESTKEK